MGLDEDIAQHIEQVKNLKPGINQFGSAHFDYRLVDNEEIGATYPAAATREAAPADLKAQGVHEIGVVAVWKGVPEKYRPIAVIHELVELDTADHERSRAYEMAFAEKFLGAEEIEAFREWRSQYD